METTVSKDSFVYREFMEKVGELGGWVENEKVRFPTASEKERFESWLADCAA